MLGDRGRGRELLLAARAFHTVRRAPQQAWKPLAGPADEAPQLLAQWTNNEALKRYVQRTIVSSAHTHPNTSTRTRTALTAAPR